MRGRRAASGQPVNPAAAGASRSTCNFAAPGSWVSRPTLKTAALPRS